MKNCIKTKELFETQNKYLKLLFEECLYPWEMIPKIGEYIQTLFNSRINGYFFMDDDVLMGENVRISPLAVIKGPAIIGANSEIRDGAVLDGNVIIGENCVIGNSSELKNCVLCDGVKLCRYNYVGYSIFGDGVSLGASACCCEKDVIDTFGAILGDGVIIGNGCALNVGTVVEKGVKVEPLKMVTGVDF